MSLFIFCHMCELLVSVLSILLSTYIHVFCQQLNEKFMTEIFFSCKQVCLHSYQLKKFKKFLEFFHDAGFVSTTFMSTTANATSSPLPGWLWAASFLSGFVSIYFYLFLYIMGSVGGNVINCVFPYPTRVRTPDLIDDRCILV